MTNDDDGGQARSGRACRARVEVRRLDPSLPLPAYHYPGDAGLDLCVATDASLLPGERAIVGTGVAVAIPPGFVGLATPRSGLAARAGLSLANTPGVIDSGYRGEVKLILVNLDPHERFEIRRGERIAQLLIMPVASAEIVERDDLSPTERGPGGLGSSGT